MNMNIIETSEGYTPTADEEYMSPAQLEYFRKRLLTWRGQLIEES